MVERLCRSGNEVVETKSQVAAALGIDRRVAVDVLMPCLAGCLVNVDLMARQNAERAWARTLRPIMYLEGCRYDETPMATTVSDIHSEVLVSGGGDDGAGGTIARRVGTIRQTLGKDSGPTKLFQTETTYGMLGKVDGATPEAAQYLGLIGTPLTWVQTLDSTAAKVIKRALEKITMPSVHSQSFPLRSRVVTSDKASSNIRCEKDIQRERGGAWGSLTLSCDTHNASTCHTKTAALVASDVSGMLNIALACGAPGAMKKFRRCVREYVMAKIDLACGPPSSDAVKWKDAMIDLFMARGPDIVARRALVRMCLPCDWRDTEKIGFVLGGEVSQFKEHRLLKLAIANGVVQSLCGRIFTTYPRHRWVGFDLAISELGILEAAHKILSNSFRIFCAESARPAKVLAPVLPFLEIASSTGARPMIVDGDAAGSGGQQDTQSAAGEPRAAEHQLAPDMAVDWAEQNARHRSVAAAYLAEDPLGRMILIRKVFEPFRQLLFDQIALGSARWEQKQRSVEAKHLLTGDGGRRKFRVEVAATGEYEDRFLDAIEKLMMGADSWEMLPPELLDLRHRSLATRLLARAASTVQALFQAAFYVDRILLVFCLMLRRNLCFCIVF